MKKILLLISLLPVISFAQDFCGLDYIEHDIQQKTEETFEEEASELNSIQLTSRGSSPSGAYSGPIYEIPLVVHVIESTDPSNAKWKLTDEEIIRWVDNMNKIYATTYGHGFYSVAEGGTVMPFKLSFARRTKDGRATNGIVRYYGSQLPDYDRWGVVIKLRNAINEDGSIPTHIGKIYQDDIRRIAPHWDETLYYNLYIVIGIDGEKTRGWLAGVASYPNFNNPGFDAFIKAVMVKTEHDPILIHEFGHSLGLIHPFDGGKRNDNKNCPINDDCNTNNDRVCDTEPIYTGHVNQVINKEAYVPTNEEINPCTGEHYNDTQYNIMGYTYQPRKFTVGQRERALREFLRHRQSLVQSRGAEPITENSEVSLVSVKCTPQSTYFGDKNNFNVGITNVKINTIENLSSVKGRYNDYTKEAWRNKFVFTNLEKGENSITISAGNGTDTQYMRAWIDYNNNGTFEDNEEIVRKDNVRGVNKTFTFNFTPPESAVKDTYLRLRVKVDDAQFGVLGACENLVSGQIEDYAVRILSEKTVEMTPPEATVSNEGVALVSNTENSASDNGSVGINTPDPKATLDVRGNTEREVLETGQPQGVLFPSFTTDERNMFDTSKIKEGTMIFNTTKKCIEVFIENTWKCLDYKP